MRRHLNIRLLAILVVAGLLLGGGLYVLHGFQVRRSARGLLTLSSQAEAAGDLARAAQHLNRYLTYQPNDEEALVKYALMIETLSQGRPARDREQALKVLQRAVQVRPQRPDVRRKAARVALELGRFAAAREHLDVLMKAAPNDAELEQFFGQCDVGEKKDDEAAARFRKVIELDPRRIDGYVLLAGLLRTRLDDPAGADQVVDQMVAANEESPRAHLERWRYLALFHPPGDSRDVDRALQLAPDDADVLLAAAGAAQLAGDFERARGHLKHGLEKSPQDTRLHRALAEVELGAGRPAEAAAALNRAIEAVPAEAEALRLQLADVLIRGGRPAEALPVIARLREGRGQAPALDLLEARARLGQRDTAGAIRLLEATRARLTAQAAATDQADQLRRQFLVQVDLLLGQGYERAGVADLELAAYQRVLEIEPQSLPARLGVASALATAGRVEPALEAYEKVAALAPEYQVAVARLALLKALQAPAGQRLWPEVNRALDRAAQATPAAVEVPVLRAEALAAQGQLDRARAALEEARDRHPDRAEPWIGLAGLAELQAKDKGPDAALALLDQAQERLGDRVDLRLARARLWARRGGPAALQALAPLANGLEAFADADRARLLDGLAGAFVQAGDAGRAKQLWGQLAQLRPEDPSLRALLFDLALQAGDDAAMQQAVQEMQAIEGQDGTLWRFGKAARLIASARAKARDRKEVDQATLNQARALLAEVARRRPNWPRVPLLEAEIAELEGNAERAIEGYQRAIQRGEPGAQPIRRLVQLLHRSSRFDEADRMLRRLPPQTPLSGTLGQVAADLSLRNKDFGRALELAQQAVPAEAATARDRLVLARVQADAGRPEEALATLRQAAQATGDDPNVWVALVQQLVRMGRKADAEAAVKEAEAKIPPAQAPAALAMCYEAIGQAARAEELYRKALAAQPDNPALLARVATFYLGTLRPAEAEPHLRRLLEPGRRLPAHELAWARRNLALVLSALGPYPLFQEALTLIEVNLRAAAAVEDLRVKATVLASRPDRRRDAIAAFEELGRGRALTPNDQFLLARLSYEDDQWPKAREQMRALLAQHGDQPTYLATFVDWLIRRGDIAEAGSRLEELRRLDPQAYPTQELQARWLKARGQDDAAVALLKGRLTAEGAPVGRIATLLDQWGRDADAEAAFRALAARPSRPEEALLLADFLARKGRLGEALDVCDRARSTCPPDVVGGVYLNVLAAAPADEGANRRVERALDEAIRAHPKSQMLLVHRAVLRSRQGRYDEAEAIYRRLLQQEGRHVAALNNLALLLAQRGRRDPEPLRLIDEAIRQAGPQPALLDTRAVVCLALGRTDEAIRDLERALAQAPDASTYFHLAQAYQRTDNRAKAAQALAKAQELGVRPDPIERPAYDRLLTQLAQE